MIFKAEGIITFEDGLELMNPSMEIEEVNYNFKHNKFSLNLSFYEIHHRHIRGFYNESVIMGLVTTADVLAFIETDPFLSQFIIQP